MINYSKYNKEIRKEIKKQTGLDISTYAINRILKWSLLNISYEIKDLKIIFLTEFKLIPNRKSINKYFKRWKEADILKPSKFFGLVETRKNMKILRSMKMQGFLKKEE